VVLVDTGARLHFGFYSTTGTISLFAGLGMAIDEPTFRAEVSPFHGVSVEGPDADRVMSVAEKAVKALGVPGVEIKVLKTIPAHVGLGSTTQMALGIAQALNVLYGLGRGLREVAALMGRGLFSGIGTAVFERGGFILDSGRRAGGGLEPRCLPRPVIRLEVPGGWRFLLLIREGLRGLDEVSEKSLMMNLEPMPEEISSRICRLILQQLIPALIWDDISVFGRALTEIQRLVGHYFSPYQGGVFSHRDALDLADFLLEEGAYGVGQSSWGPTIYAITTAEEAGGLLSSARRFIEEEGLRYEILIARPRNRGAEVSLRPG